MRIKEFFVEKYKNLNNFTAKFNENIVFLVGSNGSGKSNIIECIIRAFKRLEQLESYRDNFSRRYDRYDGPNFSITYEIDGKEVVATQDGFINIDSKIHSKLPDRIVLYSSGESKRSYDLVKSFDKTKIEMINLEYNVFKYLLLSSALKNRSFSTIYGEIVSVNLHFQPNKLRSIKRNEITDDLLLNDVLEKFSNFERKPYKTYVYNLLLDGVNYLNETNHSADIFNSLLRFSELGLFSDYSKSRKDNVEIFFTKDNYKYEFSDLGEGEQLLFSLIECSNKYNDGHTLFLLDEPDAFIHPTNVNKLATILAEYDGQVVITTHSPNLLSRVKVSRTIVINQNNQPDAFDRLYGRKINYIYRDVMDFNEYPDDVLLLIKRINDFIENKSFIDAKTSISRLSELIGKNDTSVVELSTRVFIEEFMENDID